MKLSQYHPDGLQIAPVCDLTIVPAHTGPIVRVVVLDGDDHVVTASFDKTLRVHSLVDGSCTQVLRGHKGDVHDVATCGSGLVASASDDRTLRVWNAAAGTCDIVLKCKSSVFAVASIDSDRIVSGCYDGTMDIWSRSAKRRFLTLSPKHNGAVRRINVHGRVWDSQSYQCIATLTGHTDGVLSVAMCDAFIATGSKDKTIRVYSQRDFSCLRVINAQHFGICGLVFCAGVDGGQRTDLIASASLDDGARLDDAATGLPVWHAAKSATDITVLSNGRILAAGWSQNEKPELLVWPAPRVLIAAAEIRAPCASTLVGIPVLPQPATVAPVSASVPTNSSLTQLQVQATAGIGTSPSPHPSRQIMKRPRSTSAIVPGGVDSPTDGVTNRDGSAMNGLGESVPLYARDVGAREPSLFRYAPPTSPLPKTAKLTNWAQKLPSASPGHLENHSEVEGGLVSAGNATVSGSDAMELLPASSVCKGNGASTPGVSHGFFSSYESAGISADVIRNMKQRDLAGALAAFFVDYDPDREREWSSLRDSFQRVFMNEGLSGGILVGAKALSAKKFQECVRKNWNDDTDEAWKTGYSVQMDRFVLAVQGFMNLDEASE
jgi:WD domain, G-beta repeat